MSQQQVCTCRFCGDQFTPSGITNHETYCSENPEKGVDPDRAEELGLLDSNSGSDNADHPDPDQRDSGDASLPNRQVLSSGNKDASQLSGCPRCSSTNTTTAQVAANTYRDEVEAPNRDVLTIMDSAERYCNECFSLWGGDLDRVTPLREVAQ